MADFKSSSLILSEYTVILLIKSFVTIEIFPDDVEGL